jgi:hypothetical protein
MLLKFIQLVIQLKDASLRDTDVFTCVRSFYSFLLREFICTLCVLYKVIALHGKRLS